MSKLIEHLKESKDDECLTSFTLDEIKYYRERKGAITVKVQLEGHNIKEMDK